MKLNDIIPLMERNISTEIETARAEYTTFRSRNTEAGGGIRPEAKAQEARHKAKLKSLNDELKAEKNAPSNEEKLENKKFINKVDNRKDDKEATKKRQSVAQSEGNLAANAWVKKQGGYSGAAKTIEHMAKEQTNSGKEPFDAEAIANKIGITKGSVLRWINTRPEFSSVKKYT
jgi:predicted HicB family RNase H-like nuclease